MAGWGRRAAGKIDRTQYGQDELLQTLGGQFNVDFTDYEKWKRTSKPSTKTDVGKVQGNPPLGTVGRGPKPGRLCTGIHKRNDKLLNKKKEVPKPAENVERLKILELKIDTRKKTLGEYVRRRRALLVDNLTLRETIEDYEHYANGTVKTLLRRYEGFSHGIANLKNLSQKEITEMEEEVGITRRQLETILLDIENEVDVLNNKLTLKQKELHVLQSYKDKEYPVKAIEIADLKKELEEVTSVNQEDQEELEYIIQSELDKYRKKQDKTVQNITEHVTETAIDNLHPGLQKMAVQNLLMKKEIHLHQEEMQKLQDSIKDLKEEVSKLLLDPKSNSRKQLFPELFSTRQKCTPDMEVILDIPVHQWLPI